MREVAGSGSARDLLIGDMGGVWNAHYAIYGIDTIGIDRLESFVILQ